MSYGDYDGPNKPDKGHESGSCNRTRCQATPANWYNHGSMSWYCADCRADIEFDSFNLRNWNTDFRPRLKHPMFETRPMMNDRAKIAHPQIRTNLLSSHDQCTTCGCAMSGDGYTTVMHCETLDLIGVGYEPDANPVYCTMESTS